MIKLMLDTSYLMPLLPITIDKVDKKFILNLIHDENLELYFCNISIFELAAKSIKLIAANEPITISDLTKALDTIKHTNRLKELDWQENTHILKFCLKLKQIHSDFIDCLIAATAIVKTDCLATFDKTFFELIRKDHKMRDEIKKIKPNFQFWLYNFEDKLTI